MHSLVVDPGQGRSSTASANTQEGELRSCYVRIDKLSKYRKTRKLTSPGDGPDVALLIEVLSTRSRSLALLSAEC